MPHEADVSGVGGKLKTKERGYMSYPVGTNQGIKLWEETRDVESDSHPTLDPRDPRKSYSISIPSTA